MTIPTNIFTNFKPNGMKTKKITPFNPLVFILASFLILWNCQTEDYNQPLLNDAQKIKSEFSLENFEDNTLKNNLSVDWNNYIKSENLETNIISYEFNTTLTLNNFFENDNHKFYFDYKLLATKNSTNVWSLEIVKLATENSETLNNLSLQLLDNFSGSLTHYNLNGKLIKIIGYENGEVVNKFSNTNLSAKNHFVSLPKPMFDEEGNQTEPAGGGGATIEIPIDMYTDWYKVYPNGTQVYTHSVYTGTRYEYIYVPNYNGNNPRYHYHSGGSSQNNHEHELILDDKIDDKNLKPCMTSILTQLKSLTKGISHIVVKFSGTKPNYNWIVKDGSLSGQTGTTDPPATYNKATGSITTTFDSQAWLSATDLSWARTMLHESIHANLAIDYAINRPNFIANYPAMVTDWGKLQNWNDVHHEEIAKSIVKDVAIALEEYGKTRGYNLTSQFYEDMAWGGLQGTSTFKSLSSTEQKRILDTISTELTGLDTNGNVKSQKGKNAGC